MYPLPTLNAIKTALGTFIFVLWVVLAPKAEASTFTQVFPTLTATTSGTTTVYRLSDTGCPTGGADNPIQGIKTYYGTYPDTSHLIEERSNGMSQVCRVYWKQSDFNLDILYYFSDYRTSIPTTKATGNYWTMFTFNGTSYVSTDWTGQNYYFKYYYGGSSFIIPNTPMATTSTSTITTTYTTRFTNGTTTGTSTAVSSNVAYYLNTDEYTAKNRPDFIQTNIIKKGFFGDEQVFSNKKLIAPLSTGYASTTINFDYIFTEGSYVQYFMFWNIDTNFLTFGKSTMTISFDIDGSGNVVNMVVTEITNGQVADSGYAYEECGLTNIMGCIKNALVWLFYPSSTLLDNFSTLWQNVADKKPFGYVTVTITQLEQLNTSGTTAFTLGTIPFMASIFTPFRTLIGSILWAVFAIFFYKKRLIHLDI